MVVISSSDGHAHMLAAVSPGNKVSISSQYAL